jgi:hypothetical protein
VPPGFGIPTPHGHPRATALRLPAAPRRRPGRTFSVNLDENVFHCFDKQCGRKGDVIDLWAAAHGYRLREARGKAGLTQGQVADRLDAYASFVSKVESGERRLDVVELAALCRLYGVNLFEFLPSTGFGP